MAYATIDEFNAALTGGDGLICDLLRQEIADALPDAKGRIWHAHPVWFLDGNPIMGYSRLKACVRLLFWSGQSFESAGLEPEGTFKAAERRFTHPDEIEREPVRRWLAEARAVQWDYRNIVKRRGRLERLS